MKHNDVLVRIQKNDPYIIYAESMDTVGAAYGALVSTPHQFVNYKQIVPFPEPLPVTREMMSMMMDDMNHAGSSMNMNHNMSMNHSMDMDMPTEPTVIGDTLSAPDSTYKTSTELNMNI